LNNEETHKIAMHIGALSHKEAIKTGAEGGSDAEFAPAMTWF
jgi:hypothetical protein